MRGKFLKWAILGIILSTLSGAAAYYYMRPHIPPNIAGINHFTNPDKQKREQQEVVPFPGWKDAPRKRALAVIIDNAPAARPQSGLDQADVVVETPVEGGMTRFLAVISRYETELLGPIRSARPYLVDLAKEYNGILVHAGGSEDAIEAIDREKPDHLDEIEGGPQVGAAFWRVPDRAKPHNLYASSESLRRAAKELNYNLAVPPPERSYIAQGTEISGEPMEEINIFYPNRESQIRYTYNKERKVFERFMAEKPHVNPKGEQIVAANVIVQYVPYRVLNGDGNLQLILHGEGDALIFRDGKVIKGLWQKQPGGFTRFVDTKGKSITLVPGPTWIQVVTKGTRVDY
ncbi:MAG: hypothetical protein JG781_1107 [Peptococcaceae bacterium]|jgi:hypothetical protein|nr:hypothetical protein [Peptococcaceae bacterium]